MFMLHSAWEDVKRADLAVLEVQVVCHLYLKWFASLVPGVNLPMQLLAHLSLQEPCLIGSSKFLACCKVSKSWPCQPNLKG